MKKSFVIMAISGIILSFINFRCSVNSTIAYQPNDKTDILLTDYNVLDSKESNLSFNLIDICHIDCGKDDKKYGVEGNYEDIGRVHFKRDYIQAASKDGLSFNRYFSYTVNLEKAGDYILRFKDADNVLRTYNVIINNKYVFEVTHPMNKNAETPGEWYDINLLLPKNILVKGKNTITFDHRACDNYPAAVSDIWLFLIKK
jgi:hypothetical protein